MSAATPRVWVLVGEDRAYVDGPDGRHIWLDTPAWFAWLDTGTTARLAYPLFDPAKGYIVGMMTVRKERRGRGGVYWTAYRRAGVQVRKVYLGRTPAVTQGRLATSARALLEATAGATTAR